MLCMLAYLMETAGFRGDKGEDQDAAIELAYAITIHKSQGSDFDTVFVVLPKTGRILSRELIYTSSYQSKEACSPACSRFYWLVERIY